MSKIIEVKNVSKTFGKGENLNQVLKGADLQVQVNPHSFTWSAASTESSKATSPYAARTSVP